MAFDRPVMSNHGPQPSRTRLDLDSDTARLISKSKRTGISSCSPKIGEVGWGENWEREIWEEMSGTRETVKSGECRDVL